MAYIDQAGIEARLGTDKLKQVCRDVALDAVKIAAACADANSDVDTCGASSPGYPWTVVPAKATEVAFALAVGYLYTRSWTGTPTPLWIKVPYDEAKADLAELRTGEVSWVPAEPAAKQNLSVAFVSLPDDEPTFDSPRQARFGSLRRKL